MNAQRATQQAKVSKLRTLLSGMTARPPASPESEAWQQHQHFLANLPVPLDQSPRGRMTRAINRIAVAWPWGKDAVTMFLDTRGAAFVADLTEPQLEDLHDRMLAYEDAAMNGYGPPDAPAA